MHLLRGLSGLRFRSGEEIGAELGLSRAAVHKRVQALAAEGVPIHRVRGRGYRLADGVSLLASSAITGHMSTRARQTLYKVDVFDALDSTSAELARCPGGERLAGRVCLAEQQTAGRGRRGRGWYALPYRDIAMSIGIEYPQWPTGLPALGLASAVLIAESLETLGVAGLRVKWPNDIVHADAKLCGVLLDVTGEAHGPCRVIVGIGVNVSTGNSDQRDVDQPWTDLATVSGGFPERNRVVAACLDRLLPAFAAFPGTGFSAYRARWRRLDGLRGRRVSIRGADGGAREGRAAGVDGSGRLRINDDGGGARVFTQGDVSVRPA